MPDSVASAPDRRVTMPPSLIFKGGWLTKGMPAVFTRSDSRHRAGRLADDDPAATRGKAISQHRRCRNLDPNRTLRGKRQRRWSGFQAAQSRTRIGGPPIGRKRLTGYCRTGNRG